MEFFATDHGHEPTAQRPTLPTPSPDVPELRLVSVNVALPTVIGTLRNGEEIVSGIAKRPVGAGSLRLGALNLEGDRQADLSVHGGPDKASTPTRSSICRNGTRNWGRRSGRAPSART
jgi:hypothetical protein